MQFYFFHLMPWQHLPADYDDTAKYPSTWLSLSNSEYDPKQGFALYNRYLDELEYAEKLGFDGVAVNEHHQNAYGTMPAPNVIAGMLARRTSRVKSAVLGNGIPLRDLHVGPAGQDVLRPVSRGGAEVRLYEFARSARPPDPDLRRRDRRTRARGGEVAPPVALP